MSLCPVCGRVYCDHTTEERGQTFDEMMRPLSPEELVAWRTEPADSPVKIACGRRHAHDPATPDPVRNEGIPAPDKP